jgi:hypothetical protein
VSESSSTNTSSAIHSGSRSGGRRQVSIEAALSD